jgi:hypothetical protein
MKVSALDVPQAAATRAVDGDGQEVERAVAADVLSGAVAKYVVIGDRITFSEIQWEVIDPIGTC